MIQLVLDILVPNVERTVEFYRQVLGFELVSVRGRGEFMHAQLRSGRVDIMFRSAAREFESEGAVAEPVHRIRWHFQVDDVYALHERVNNSGHAVRFLRRLEPTLFGTAEFAIEDVDGRTLYFSQPVATPREA